MWGYIAWAVILLLIIAMLVKLRSMYSIYICPKCEHQFTLSPKKDFFYPQIMYKKLARCPECRKFVAAAIIKNEEAIERLEKAREVKPKTKKSKNKKN